jgi:hypothetical protein
MYNINYAGEENKDGNRSESWFGGRSQEKCGTRFSPLPQRWLLKRGPNLVQVHAYCGFGELT